jgi:hypothetical protein
MPTEVIDPYATLADILVDAIEEEFSDLEYLNVKHDRLHESISVDGRVHVGISPEDQEPVNVQLGIGVLIQFYMPYEKMVNPAQEVDPRVITMMAERLRVCLQKHRTTATGEVWFFEVGTVRFPKDGTGNKTRFEARITGTGNNMGLIETIG